MSVGGLKLQPWALWVEPELRWSVNFDWIHRSGHGISVEGTEALAEKLADLPGFRAAAADARADGWRRRPGLAGASILAAPEAVDRISNTVRELYDEAEQLGPRRDGRDPLTGRVCMKCWQGCPQAGGRRTGTLPS